MQDTKPRKIVNIVQIITLAGNKMLWFCGPYLQAKGCYEFLQKMMHFWGLRTQNLFCIFIPSTKLYKYSRSHQNIRTYLFLEWKSFDCVR